MKRNQKQLWYSIGLLAAFILWTVIVSRVDVQKIGPQDSSVGLAGLNRFVHDLTGVHFLLYTITDWLGLVPVGVCMGFGLLGLAQWIRRKRIWKVDHSILMLGGFYLITIGVYFLFEQIVINYRPVLIDGCLEASYPSSTTMLTLCVMPTALLQFKRRIRNQTLRNTVCILITVFTTFMVMGRLISGVHWFTDIVGGILLSSALVMLYRFACHLQ